MQKALFLLLFCCYLQVSLAQPQTLDPAQQAVIDKVTYAIRVVFNKLNDPDWVLRNDYYDAHMVVVDQQPGAPLGVNNNYGRVYQLLEGSPTYVKLIQPLLDHKKDLAMAKQYDSLSNVDKKIAALSRFEIHANINIAMVDMHQQSKAGSYEQLFFKGCTYSCRTSANSVYGVGRTYYYLLFGNWDTSQCSAAGHVVNFKFKNPEKTPFVENIDIQIIGDNDDVQKLINKTDWNLLSNALTL
jgi:hypothetical protein